jgi:hypothetical protein
MSSRYNVQQTDFRKIIICSYWVLFMSKLYHFCENRVIIKQRIIRSLCDHTYKNRYYFIPSRSIFYVSCKYIRKIKFEQHKTCVDCSIVVYDTVWSGSHLQYTIYKCAPSYRNWYNPFRFSCYEVEVPLTDPSYQM